MKPVIVLALLAGALAGCQGGSSLAPKPADLTEFRAGTELRVAWQGSVGASEKHVFFPAVSGKSVYATGRDGRIVAFDAAGGAQLGTIESGQNVNAGVGAGPGIVLVGTARGELLAFDPGGKALWAAQLTGEVLAPATVEDGVVVARTGEGSVFGLDASNGARKWVYQRSVPPLSVRSHAGLVVYRGGVFAGFPGGRLVGLALANGNVGWEGVVALPRGTTELERVADVTSLPVVDDRQACAVAFQGRVACFDVVRGSLLWAREASSIAGMGADSRNLYITDSRSAVVAHDRATGGNVWKQDKLFGRDVTGPLVLAGHILVGDLEGYVHALSPEDGAFKARIATDGSAIIAPPRALDETRFVVQTREGGVYAISIEPLKTKAASEGGN